LVYVFLYKTEKSPARNKYFFLGDESRNVRELVGLLRCSYFYNEMIVHNNNTRSSFSHFIVPLYKKDVGLINLHYNEILITETVHFQTGLL